MKYASDSSIFLSTIQRSITWASASPLSRIHHIRIYEHTIDKVESLCAMYLWTTSLVAKLYLWFYNSFLFMPIIRYVKRLIIVLITFRTCMLAKHEWSIWTRLMLPLFEGLAAIVFVYTIPFLITPESYCRITTLIFIVIAFSMLLHLMII